MVTVKEKTIVTTKISADCPSHARSDLTCRDVSMIVDEPQARGGTNLGFTPTETFVAALIGCTNVVGNRVAHHLGVDIKHMRIEAEYDMDRRGPLLQAEVDVPFVEVRLDIHVTTEASEAEIDKVKTELAKYCPVAKMLTTAGTRIVDTWHIVRP